MMVADAPLLVSLLTDGGPTGRAARKAFSDSGGVCIPDLAYVETVVILRRQWLQGTIMTDRWREAIKDLIDLPLQHFPTYPLMRRAFELRAHVTTQDACYVALAEALRCDLATGDQRLAKSSGPRCQIRVIGRSAGGPKQVPEVSIDEEPGRDGS